MVVEKVDPAEIHVSFDEDRVEVGERVEYTPLAPVRISVTAYARLRGVTWAAVMQRIRAGSLPTAAKRVKGKWTVDPALAESEWAAHTQPRVDSRKQNGVGPPSALAAATSRERNARAESVELELARKKGLLVPAVVVEQRWSALVVGARTGLLGIPTRYKQRVPHASAADLVILEALIREALEELVTQSQGETHG